MQRLLLGIVGLLLIGCSAGEAASTDQIVLTTNRYVAGGLFNYHPTYVVRSDGSGDSSTRLPAGLEDEPEWSPDGQWIVSSTVGSEGNHAGGSPKIYLMRSDGSEKRRITNAREYEINPSWSPDGRRIVYAADARISILDIQCRLRSEQCYPQAIPVTEGRSPRWSPDGKRIVYAGYMLDGGIYIINAAGGDKPINLVPHLGNCRHPNWSPDGQKIVFSCSGVIYTVNPDGSDLAKLREDAGDPSWSRDGSKIAFVGLQQGAGGCVGEPCPSDDRASDAVFLMDADGNRAIRVSQHDNERVLWYTWLPAQSAREKR